MEILILIALITVVWVALDYSRNKLKRCPQCKGKGELPSMFFPNRYRPCPRCRRSGEIGR